MEQSVCQPVQGAEGYRLGMRPLDLLGSQNQRNPKRTRMSSDASLGPKLAYMRVPVSTVATVAERSPGVGL